MKKEVAIDIINVAFPTQYATDAEKDSEEFGLQVGQSIQYEWFRKDGNQCRYYGQWRDFHRLRLYARGEQPVQKYKDELAINGDLSYLNLDWTPVPILPKFIDIVVNGMSDRLFKVKAYAQDAVSQEKRMQYQDTIEGQMAAKPILKNIKDLTGLDPFVMDPDQLPETDEDLALHMQLKYKPAIEIAEEEAINTVFDDNKFDDIRWRLDYDRTVLGISVAKHEFLPNAGVKISYVDPANCVYSYTEDPHFKDCFYWGEIKTVPISELLKIDPTLTNEDLQEIAMYSQSWYNYFNVAQFYENSMFHRDTCTLLYFNYKTFHTEVYKKKKLNNGGFRMIPKDDTFDPPAEMMEEGGFEKVARKIDVWYEGIMVMGTNYLLKWELAKNMVRPDSATQHAIPQYVAVAPRMYKGVIESLCRRMIPFADGIQMTHLKIQQVVSRVVPDGVFIDADGINEVDLGTGAAYNPEDALRLYFQTGSVVGRSYTGDGEFNNARVPIQELNTNSGASKLQMLIANYNHYLDMLRSVTGLNEARDGSTPDPRALVGVQKLAALNSNVATRHILDGSIYTYRSLAEAISYRVADILQYADFKDEFANKIGKYNVQILEDIKDLYLYSFGIYIEVEPDEEEKAQLEKNIDTALAKGDIYLEDAIDIREVRNLKLANQLLKLKRIKKQEREEKMAMQGQAMAAQTAAQTQQIAAQTAIQKINAEIQGKAQLKQIEAQWDIKKLETEAQLKSHLMAEEFRYNMQLAGMTEKMITDRDKMKEDNKTKRIGEQNSQQSMLIHQRKNNLPPMNFESNEDSLDGLGLQEFEPR